MSDARTTIVQRPMGPRRPGVPLPPTINTGAHDLPAPSPNRRPLFPPRGPSTLSPPSTESARSLTPVLSLSIPRPPSSRPALPKIQLAINPNDNGGRLFDNYAGGPGGPQLAADSAPEERTIMPPGAATATVIAPQKKAEAFDNLRDLVSELEAIRVTSLASSSAAKAEPLPFTDDVFEEISRLGEGAGGAVHKVRYKPTGMIMARKTITTHEAPQKQLERELSIMANAKHVNIIEWYGAYMTPSRTEVKILLEYGEGGSLEGVGKRIKERGGRVGEKIAGRIAEGVSLNPS